MEKKYIVLFTVILTAMIGLIGYDVYGNKQTTQIEHGGDKKTSQAICNEWDSIVSESVNEKGINLSVEDEVFSDAGSQRYSYMTSKRTIMIAASAVRDLLDASIHVYEKNSVIIEKGTISAALKLNSSTMMIGNKKIELSEKVVRKNKNVYIPIDVFTHGFGYETKWSYLDNTETLTWTDKKMNELPSFYDCSLKGRTPVVKDQGAFGTCWTFASLTALETTLLPEEDMLFSEENMALGSSFNSDLYSGGDYIMSMAYLTSWQGPVLEKDDTYGDGVTPPNIKAAKHVQEIQIIKAGKREEIKKMIFKYGGVQSSLYTSLTGVYSTSEFYNQSNSAYCYNGKMKPNHDVVIIGWDDNFPADKFLTKVEGDGAFICRNSWGSEFGDDGDFYVSYYDSNIGQHNIVYTKVENPDNFDNIYQSDYCGWVGNLGFKDSNTAYFANVYKAKTDEVVKAVGFYATSENASYEVYICDEFENVESFDNRTNIVASGRFANAGYYTVHINNTKIYKGKKYAVIVKINTPGSTKPIAIEYKGEGAISDVITSDGEGYYSSSGRKWYRAEKKNVNICLKAYTDKD